MMCQTLKHRRLETDTLILPLENILISHVLSALVQTKVNLLWKKKREKSDQHQKCAISLGRSKRKKTEAKSISYIISSSKAGDIVSLKANVFMKDETETMYSYTMRNICVIEF